MASPKIAPDAKYIQQTGRVVVSGNQALVRLPVEQARRDREAGIHTAGFVSGYRGSPLGHLDHPNGPGATTCTASRTSALIVRRMSDLQREIRHPRSVRRYSSW
jgi:hypothetical protein